MEGIGCILAGMWGTGSGSTSYVVNVGIIGATRVWHFLSRVRSAMINISSLFLHIVAQSFSFSGTKHLCEIPTGLTASGALNTGVVYLSIFCQLFPPCEKLSLVKFMLAAAADTTGVPCFLPLKNPPWKTMHIKLTLVAAAAMSHMFLSREKLTSCSIHGCGGV